MGYMVILLVIDDGVYVCIYKVYSSVFTEYTHHALVYDINFSQLEKSECCGSIIDNISYTPICVLEEKYRKIKTALFLFLLVRPPRSQSLLIMGWCSSIPEHRL